MRAKTLIGAVAACAALLVATPLVAGAAGSITSSDIVNGTIKSKDIKTNAIKGSHVRDGSLSGADVADGSLSGADVADGSLSGADVADGSLSGADLSEGTLGNLDASTLDGHPATTYLDRVAFATGTSADLASSPTTSLLGPLGLTVPAGVGFVTIQGSATFNSSNTGFGVYYSVDSACSTSGTPYAQAQWENTGSVMPTQASASINVAVPVTAGVHTFRLCSNNAAGHVSSRTLLVTTVAVGP